ncbi:aminopeptidase P family protein [Acetobacter sp.]|jgi:Xaa-Pro aminopeptidase|uniref:aminopeptidase P family protein n=1 Tax=Acetobacter sp. TaxID=440 RepID=UPI0025C2295D|nr:aminopeptidase P family protein [Acetobacter sp.]MCH4091526.1 aminopeptidase P family protein [Acetobacter sp.]MCI1299504.1 aminopeptidase P family protein [Acetobacter sp.]MCI1316906.1 aminopeptidase P family protein [Acetobacter sp.]
MRDRLQSLRALLKEHSLDGLIIPRSDEYLGEYVPACAERMAWISGFTGSAGLAIVLSDRAAVFSDGRYITQMDDQVDGVLWERHHITEAPPRGWLEKNAPAKARIGYDPRIVSRSALLALQTDAVTFIPTAFNLVDVIWTDRPAPPSAQARIHPLEFSGQTSADKRHSLGTQLAKNGWAAAIIADCTSVAWLLNIRGTDVPHTPVVLSFAVLHSNGQVDLFVDGAKITPELRDWLGDDVTLLSPDRLEDSLRALKGQTIAVDPAATPVWFSQTLEDAGATIVDAVDPCALPRARKNTVEQQGARAAHLRDAVAVCRFLHWLDTHAAGSTELELVERLQTFRAEAPEYRDDSFDTISGAGPNGAIIHYRVTPETSRLLGANTVYLVDSGAQYPDGTTDITRTVWTGPDEPPSALREAFSRVLKGNLSLGRARFPAGTTGSALDGVARYALWQGGLDFDHGTGHGVGSYLSVHEGPQRISKLPSTVPLEAGMILSNEPGYYRPGSFGIRLETLEMVRTSEVGQDGRNFLEFETLTLAPFDRHLVDPAVMGPEALDLLDSYHARVLAEVGPLLSGEAATWLAHACSPIKRK